MEVKKAQGNPGRRPLNENRPEPPKGPLECPENFGEEEANIWAQTLANSAPGVIRPADSEILAAYVEQVWIKRQAMRELKQMGADNRQYMSVETERGWVKNPQTTVVDAAVKQIRSLGAELGLSPASRERLHTSNEKPQDPLEAFLSRKAVSQVAQ